MKNKRAFPSEFETHLCLEDPTQDIYESRRISRIRNSAHGSVNIRNRLQAIHFRNFAVDEQKRQYLHLDTPNQQRSRIIQREHFATSHQTGTNISDQKTQMVPGRQFKMQQKLTMS